MISDFPLRSLPIAESLKPLGLHVAFVNPINEFYSPVSGGAVATILMQSARELLRRGYRVSVLTPVNDDVTYPHGEIFPLHSPRRGDLRLDQRVYSRLRCRAHRWVWPYYDYYMRSIIAQLKRFARLPQVVISFNDLVLSRHLRARFPGVRYLVNLQNEIRIRRNDTARLFASIDKVLACSQHIRDWTACEYDVPREKLATLHSGVDLGMFFPRADFLQRRDTLRVLFVGRIDRNKGPDIAADAVSTLQREGRKVSYTVAGARWFYRNERDDEDPYFRDLMEKLKGVNASYLGHVDRARIGKVFREHDVVCVLSRSTEPFGLVVLEAMASGCAVIASDRGGLPDACGSAGVLVNPDNASETIGVLRRFHEDANALAEAKHRCRAHALACSWASHVDELAAWLPATKPSRG